MNIFIPIRCDDLFKFILVICFVTIANPVGLLSQENAEDLFLTQQTEARNAELERLSKEIGLAEEHFETIRESVKDNLQEGAKLYNQITGETRSSSIKGYRGMLSRTLADAIHNAAKEFVDSEKLTQYRDDYQKFMTWEDQIAQKHVLVFLDDFLQLTPEQYRAIEKSLSENWKSVWNYRVVQNSFDGYKATKFVLVALENDEDSPKQITSQLTKVQKEIFGKLHDLGGNYSRLIGLSEDAEADLIKPEMEFFLARVKERISEIGDLDKKQIARLNVGFKGAWRQVAAHRRAMVTQYQNNGTLWNMSALMESPFNQMRNEPKWQQTIKGVLSGEPLEQYLAEEERRQQRRIEIGPGFAISFLTREWRLPFDELTNLYEKGLAKVKEDQETNVYRATYCVFEITEDELNPILSEESRTRLAEKLNTAKLWVRTNENN